MARRRNPFPKPRQHKGAAVVDVYDGPTRRTVTLGPWGSDQARQEYERLLTRLRLGEPEAGAERTPEPGLPADLTVAEALVRYAAHITAYYRNPDGTPTGTAEDIKITLGYLRRLCGELPLAEFDVRTFKAIRQAMIDDGRVRNQVNRRAKMVRAFVRWCVEDGLPVTTGVLERLGAVKALAPGRDGAPEGEARAPADPAAVEKVLPLLSPSVAAIVRLLRLTGARPSEVLKLKTQRGGPDGRRVGTAPDPAQGQLAGQVAGRLPRPRGPGCAGPVAGQDTGPGRLRLQPGPRRRRASGGRAAARKTKRWPSHLKRNQAKRRGAARKRAPGEVYSHVALSCAVRRACAKAGVPPFTPYALRHLRAVELRERFGPDHVRAVPGHSALNMSDHYSKAADRALATQAAASAG